MNNLSGGHWVTIHGHHVYLKGAALSTQHVEDLATKAGLSNQTKQTVLDAHANGLLSTDKQIHGAIADIAGAVAVGFDEHHAAQEAIKVHGGPKGTAAPVAPGQSATTPVWLSGKGKAKGAHVPVMTHGAPLHPDEVYAYGNKFGLTAGGEALMMKAVADGHIKTDTQLAQLVADTIHVFKMTGADHSHAVKLLLSGKSATEAIAALKAPIAAPAPVVAPTPSPAPAPSASPSSTPPPPTPQPDFTDLAQLKEYAKSAKLTALKTAHDAILQHLADGSMTAAQLPDVVQNAVSMVQGLSNKHLSGAFITSSLFQLKNNGAAPPTTSPTPATTTTAPSAAPVTAPASGTHHVTLGGQKMTVDHSQPVSEADVDTVKGQLKMSASGELGLKSLIANGTIQNHGQLLEKAAMVHASAQAQGYTSLNGYGLSGTKNFHTIESLLDAAHLGDATAKSIEAKLDSHSFQSPAAKASAQNAAKQAQADAAFQHASPADHTHKQVGGKGGYNDGGLYELPDGTKNYVKTPPSAEVAHNEHLANEIYKALGISAPNSKVFTDGSGKTRYASQVIDNQGDLAKTGITRDIAHDLLKGFAADVLLGNHDVLGNGNIPLSNVVVGANGKAHRIDNGGSLLFTGTGNPKSAQHKTELREWEGFASPTTNANYASVFHAAGVKDAASIPGVGQQIKAITKLRDAHGGWDSFIAHAAPDMPAAQRAETAKLLEDRTKLLEAKVKTVAGGNSLVGARTFHYDNNGGGFGSHGNSHEQTLIAHHNQHAPKLSKEEITAVTAFKGGSYSSWNQSLLGSSELSAKNLEHTKVLDAMFQKPNMVLGQDSALSRKVTLSDEEQKALASLAPGSVIAHTPTFQSTSTDSNMWYGNTHFCILAPAEMPAVTPKAHTTVNGGEKEVLLPRGISYRVVSVSGPGGAAPDHTPAGWHWDSSATKVVLEAIVPGVNDIEHDGVGTHMISADLLKKRAATLAKNHANAPLPNLSSLPSPTVPTWNGGVAPGGAAPPTTAPPGTP